MKKPWKIVLRVFLGLLCALVLTVGGYVAYVLIHYDRIPDQLPLTPEGKAVTENVEAGGSYTVVTQNLGFGAYTADYTFFMDGGTESRARSRESVENCIRAGADEVRSLSPDFILFQEVDLDSTRSFHTDQKAWLLEEFPDMAAVSAVNYHSAYLMYPLHQPHGASNSSLLTLSRYGVASAVRRSLPISTDLSKLLDLDRCYSVQRIPAKDGKELILYNVHASAYGGSDEIRTAQMSMLLRDMQSEYEQGNWCVCGGDFNNDFTGSSVPDLNNGKEPDLGWTQPFPKELLPACIRRAVDYDDGVKPTCRNNDVPYVEGNFVIIVDGFLVSENVEVTSVRNVQTGFVYSDHNPVVMTFTLQ